jgi:hypothetical protein
MMISDGLPRIKRFLNLHREPVLLVLMMTGFVVFRGRMSASKAAEAIPSKSRHRGNVGRFLENNHRQLGWILNRLARRLIRSELRSSRGEWFFILDQTFTGHQGTKTENTFSRGNYRPRPKKSNRHQKKTSRHSCHCFVMGLLITPHGIRIPMSHSYFTKEYCKAHGITYRTQTEIGRDLIRLLPVPLGKRVTVLGDTAFEAKIIRECCQEYGFSWITPVNPERVLEGPKPRPRVRSLISRLRASQLTPIRLKPSNKRCAAQRRVALCRLGSSKQCRTFYVHTERQRIHNMGDVLLVFSTPEKPDPKKAVKIKKILVTNETDWSAERIVRYYDLRWQIELMFKECKSVLGLDHYRFQDFTKVEGYVLTCLITFLYLEWYRAMQLKKVTDPAEQQRLLAARTYGMCRLVRQHIEQNDLLFIARACRTKSGLKRLRRQLKTAIPIEYRQFC